MARIKKAQNGLGELRTGEDIRLVRSKSTPKKQTSVYKSGDNKYRMKMTTKPRYQTADKRSVADETRLKERRTLKGFLSGAPSMRKRAKQSLKEVMETMPKPKISQGMRRGGKLSKKK